MNEEFEPQEWGYSGKGLSARTFGNGGWIITHPNHPPIAQEKGTGWYCLMINLVVTDSSMICCDEAYRLTA